MHSSQRLFSLSHQMSAAPGRPKQARTAARQSEGTLMSTEKYVAIAGVSRATAYRELTDLVDAGLLLRTEQGRETRYEVAAP